VGKSESKGESKGAMTRHGILEHAFRQASRLGLEGLTIGALADDLDMSKSGLFAHFQSKEALQLAVVDHAAGAFVERVVKPTLQAPRGEPRLRALLRHWLEWEAHYATEGGCFFAAASFELDDRPGAARDRLVQLQRDFLELIASIVRSGAGEGHLRADASPEQLAFEIYGIMLVTAHCTRLLGDRRAEERAWTAFEALVAAARADKPAATRGGRRRGAGPGRPPRATRPRV
jgi:AcrR family transcriptional regulator